MLPGKAFAERELVEWGNADTACIQAAVTVSARLLREQRAVSA